MLAAGAALPQQPQLAGFGVRTVAYLVDAILLSFVVGAFPYLVITANSATAPQPGVAGGGSIVVSIVYFLIFWSYLGGGRTLGMRLMRLKVVREDGRLIGVLDAAARWIGLWISFAVCFIGILWVIGDARKQGWHDKLAHTLVVRV